MQKLELNGRLIKMSQMSSPYCAYFGPPWTNYDTSSNIKVQQLHSDGICFPFTKEETKWNIIMIILVKTCCRCRRRPQICVRKEGYGSAERRQGTEEERAITEEQSGCVRIVVIGN